MLGSREPSPVSPPKESPAAQEGLVNKEQMADWAAQNSPGALLDSPGSDDLSADIDRLNAINAQIAELSQSDNDGGYDDEFEEEGEESMIEIIGGEDSIGDMDSFSQSFGDESGSDVGQNSVLDVSVSMRSTDLGSLHDKLTRESDQVFDAERPDS